MTRSLGDFYAHSVGVSCEPEVRLMAAEYYRVPRSTSECR